MLKPSRHTGEDESLLVKMTVVVSALAAGYVGAMLACGHSGLLCAQWDMLCALWLGAFNKVFRWLFPLTQVMVRHQTLHSSAIASAMEGSLGCVSQCESICGAYLSTQFGPINLRARARWEDTARLLETSYSGTQRTDATPDVILHSLDLVSCPEGSEHNGIDCTVTQRVFPSTLFRAEMNGGGDTSMIRGGDLLQARWIDQSSNPRWYTGRCIDKCVSICT